MKITNIGEISEGRASEVDKGVVRLYDKNSFPIIEIHSHTKEMEFVDSDEELNELAKDLRILWNRKVKMNCENCGNEIEDFAICSDCEIELRGAKMYVYIKSEETLWTVGFYSPDGEWNPESDFDNPNDAADRVAYLNGNVKRTPVELAAEDLFKLCCDIYEDKKFGFDKLLEIRWMKLERLVEKLKTPNNQSIQKNPSEQDEYKSAP